MCIDFCDNMALKTLYFSIVRSQIEYNIGTSLIWHTDYNGENTSLSWIENIFLRYLSYKCNVQTTSRMNIHSEYYKTIGEFFKTDSLKNKYLLL